MVYPYKTLLFYKYVTIANPEEFVAEHLQFCKKLGIKGRILVASEGINGAVSGTEEQIDAYIEGAHQYKFLKDMIFKSSYSEGHIFQKMHVRLRNEICALKLEDDVDPNMETGKYLPPEELHKWYENNEDFIIVDTRNNYEWEVGKFKNARVIDIEYFRDFPKGVDDIEDLKDKKVVAYCTGGIRCEKASAYLIKRGFKDVYQLEGGILNYAAQTNGRHWEGKCFMFDDRLVVPINHTEEDKVISQCSHCQQSSDRYMNCPNIDCNKLYICCEACDEEKGGFCCESCQHSTRVRDRRPVSCSTDAWELIA